MPVSRLERYPTLLVNPHPSLPSTTTLYIWSITRSVRNINPFDTELRGVARDNTIRNMPNACRFMERLLREREEYPAWIYCFIASRAPRGIASFTGSPLAVRVSMSTIWIVATFISRGYIDCVKANARFSGSIARIPLPQHGQTLPKFGQASVQELC